MVVDQNFHRVNKLLFFGTPLKSKTYSTKKVSFEENKSFNKSKVKIYKFSKKKLKIKIVS